MPYVDRKGVRLFYESRGRGPGVLLSNGYSATSEMWQGQVADLEKDHQVVVWDMRGHGQSDSPEDPAEYSEQATVDDMAAILDECGIDRAVVGGLSLGGYISMAFHLAHPERVAALMLFDTGPGYRSDDGRAQWNKMVEGMAARLDERGLDGLGSGREVRRTAHRSAAGLAKAARGILAQRDSRVIDSLPAIDVPTLGLVGEHDRQFLSGTDYMAKKIPNATKVVLTDAAHAANIDQPDAFNRAVREFLTSAGL